ncbi:hypothetical protein Scep_023751 [Stephania cephalantha]|uniref:Uncharacterized protein n=1 Tax=Stephania cephalantha TaxID=152367 RepID=A0AAP0HXM1_9MAGN
MVLKKKKHRECDIWSSRALKISLSSRHLLLQPLLVDEMMTFFQDRWITEPQLTSEVCF